MLINNLASTLRPVVTLTVALLMSSACLSSAQADNHFNQHPSVVVKYGDLDLTTDVGVHRLYKRIIGAAERVCPENFTLDLQLIELVRTCRADAIAHAVQSINNQQLAVIHAQSLRHS